LDLATTNKNEKIVDLLNYKKDGYVLKGGLKKRRRKSRKMKTRMRKYKRSTRGRK
jgi:hypothetical protein